jgi:DNA-binding LytR/AlgR family response regulator
MKTYRVVIADDEPLSLRRLEIGLARAADVEIVGAAKDGNEASALIATLAPDIVILDIEMTGANGLRVCETIPPDLQPAVVFATAHKDFALDAFDLGVTDYLLKPFALARLDEAMARCRAHCDRRALEARNRELDVGPNNGRWLQALWCLDRGRRHRVAVDDILWIGGERDYVRLHTSKGIYLWRGALGSLGARLDPSLFIRVHRSAIVRLAAIDEFRAGRSGGLELIVARIRVPVSRQHAAAVRARLVGR